MAKKTLQRSMVALLVALVLAALIVPQPAHACQCVHIVQRGETLSRIAARYGTTVWAIARANSLYNPNYIWAGQRLVIPCGTCGGPVVGGTYIVQRGDTLFSIARRYGTTVSALAAANGIWNPSLIYVGQRLWVGGGGWTPAPSTVYIVRPGDTLYSIARRFGTTVSALAAANGIWNPSLIYVGQRIRITP